RLQVIHNSADLAAQSVDVFVNGDILLPGFKFRTASPFVTVPAEVELSIDIAPAGAGIENSVGTFDFTLAADETYIAIANGIVSADGYEPSIAFDIYPYAGAREAAMDSSKTDVLVFHGSTDAP
ncbi:DUF4397 domain-containing protein, partial [Arthrospira platensis SPKY1]|nr:DUF4397 domain-containing protein [Arthrospira platensis SPKY1]